MNPKKINNIKMFYLFDFFVLFFFFERNFVLEDMVRPAFLGAGSLLSVFFEILCGLFLLLPLLFSSKGLFFLVIPFTKAVLLPFDFCLLLTASGCTLTICYLAIVSSSSKTMES